MAILVCSVSDEWSLEQCSLRVQTLAKSMTGEEVARELINVLSMRYGITSDRLFAAMRDRASVNNLAMQTVQVVYPLMVDIGCYSHTLDHVGEKSATPTLKEFLHLLISLFIHSPKARVL